MAGDQPRRRVAHPTPCSPRAPSFMVAPAMQPNVHDAFFKEMLSRPEHAASLLQQILPARIATRLHFPSLAPCTGSYFF